MTYLRVTADANLLASGALRLRLDAAPVRFIDSWRAGEFALTLSQHLLKEIDDTFDSPYFVRRLTPERRQVFLELLRTDAVIISLTVTVTGVASHPEADLVLATAHSGACQFLVTGDHELLALKHYEGVIIVGVHDFLAMLPGLTTTEDEGDG